MLAHTWWRLLTGGAMVGGLVRPAIAQTLPGEVQLASRGPAFFSVDPSTGVRGDARNAAVLRQSIAVALTDVSIPEALDRIAQRSGLKFAFRTGVFPAGARVSLSASHITVEAALTVILLDAGLDVELLPSGFVGFVARPGGATAPARPQPAPGGTIVGSVTDSVTGATIPDALVRVEETGRAVVSGPQGKYTIANVPPGSYRVTVRRVGYIVRARTVFVQEGEVVRLNFKLSEPMTKLDEVVTTAVGDQRRYQVGNVISTVNVDSIALTAPITSVTDVLTARVPGLEVVETGGLTGSGEAIRIRGQSSMLLQSDPIIIVDGVRQDNTAGGTNGVYFAGVTPTPSRLNDIDVSQIETIDVLKGPAASTEYGTDAANGVIVITTKRGTSGTPQWHAAVEDGANTIPTNYPDFYYSWGHLTNGSGTVQCPLVASQSTPQSSNGSCGVDSVTHDNPLNHSSTSIYGTGSRQKYDLDVRGGSETIRYFLAGGASNETSALQVPPVVIPLLQAAGLPRSTYSPNGENQRSGRANTFVRLGSTADVAVNIAYMSTYQTIPSLQIGLLRGAAQGGPLDSANGYGYGYRYDPIAAVATASSQQTNRFTGGLAANWRPTSWLVTYADAGIDHGTQANLTVRLPQLYAYHGIAGNHGVYVLTQRGTDIYSGDLRAAATAQLSRVVRAVTTVGANLRDTRASSLTSAASNLSDANLSLVGAATTYTTQGGGRSATLGGYAEEQLQLVDRLFFTGALRVDAASGFGSNYQAAAYPKVSASWLAVRTGQTSVRLRGAFGASGVAPYNGLTLQLFTPVAVPTANGTASAVQLSQPGNPNLRPERTGEWEGGVDVGLWGNRLSLEFSGYQKTTTDALYSEALGWDYNNYSTEINIGEIRNSGIEGSVTVVPIQTRSVSLTATINGSVNHNMLVRLAPGLTPLRFGLSQQIRPGYPLYGFWGTQYTYSDANHDGIIEAGEVTVDTGASYMGSSIPTQTGSFDTHLSLFRGTLSIGALLTYQGGYRVYDSFAQTTDRYGTSKGLNVPGGSSLADQARFQAQNSPQGCCFAAGYFEDGTVLRLQEISLTYALPPGWARAIHVHTMSLTGAVRNLAFWTRYSNGDPSASFSASGTASIANTQIVNNDIRESGVSAVPLARYYQLRLNVGF